MATEPRKKFAIIGQGTICDGAAYWATLARRLPDGRRADVLLRQGEALRRRRASAGRRRPAVPGNVHSHFPGTHAAWIILGILEFGVFVLLVASLIRLEFLPHRDKGLMQVGLAVAMLAFACLALGRRRRSSTRARRRSTRTSARRS